MADGGTGTIFDVITAPEMVVQPQDVITSEVITESHPDFWLNLQQTTLPRNLRYMDMKRNYGPVDPTPGALKNRNQLVPFLFQRFVIEGKVAAVGAPIVFDIIPEGKIVLGKAGLEDPATNLGIFGENLQSDTSLLTKGGFVPNWQIYLMYAMSFQFEPSYEQDQDGVKSDVIWHPRYEGKVQNRIAYELNVTLVQGTAGEFFDCARLIDWSSPTGTTGVNNDLIKNGFPNGMNLQYFRCFNMSGAQGDNDALQANLSTNYKFQIPSDPAQPTQPGTFKQPITWRAYGIPMCRPYGLGSCPSPDQEQQDNRIAAVESVVAELVSGDPNKAALVSRAMSKLRRRR